MGQYWLAVNLDKKEFIDPHKLGAGLKLWEQLANHPGTGAALIILCAAMPEPRGGGDFDMGVNWHGLERNEAMKTGEIDGVTPGPMPEGYSVVARRTIGRWAGDRIALVGDYAEDSDLPAEFHASKIYGQCSNEGKYIYNRDPKGASYRIDPYCLENGKPHKHRGKYAHWVVTKPPKYKDISDDVCRVIEHELGGKFEGTGWRGFKRDK
jgi:hypothetical protein